jgi:glycosyltransferase involved in cell wall biosynthesis
MKILIVSTSDIQGGAARAAYRLHQSLLSQKIESQMLVQDKSCDDFTVISLSSTKVQKAFAKIRPIIDALPVKFYKTKTLFSPNWIGTKSIINKINELKPDIVHLHWINGGMMRIEDISKINIPIVWTLHDNWLFTGGCHIMWKCEEYKNDCGCCPVLESNKEKDLSRKVFYRKKNEFTKIENMFIVSVSNWLNNCSKNSTLLKEKKHIILPNPIDTKIYKLFDKVKSRELWNLPKDRKLVLFGANSATSDINKGFKPLSEAIDKFQRNDIELVIFGSSQPKESQDFGFKTHYLGHLYDDVSLVTLYNAVDVMVVPSLQEAFGQTASESMSCGTPVVAFKATGLMDIVDHKINGYLAKPYDTTDLVNGIEWVLNNEYYDKLCKNAREKVLQEFDSQIVAKKYIELYQDILNEK